MAGAANGLAALFSSIGPKEDRGRLRVVATAVGVLAIVGSSVGSFVPRAATAADQVSFVARTDRTRVGLGESLVCEVTLSLGGGSASGYRAPALRGFRIVSEQPSQSTQIQMGGGANFMQTVYTWRYVLQPLNKGALVIGPASIRVGGRELATSAINIAVVDGPTASTRSNPAPPPVRQHGFPGGFPFSVDTDPSPSPGGGAGRSFLRVVPSKTRAYVGEQVNVEWHLYLSHRPDKYQTITEPRAEGFWIEDLPVPSQRGLSLVPQTVDGQTYLTALLAKRAMFPLSPGRHSVLPMESEISQVDFFGSTVRTERLKAEPLVIEAVALPTAGQPRGFDPAAVGQFSIEAKVDRDRVAVGDAATITVTVSGQGNLRKMAAPALEPLSGWKAYDPKITLSVDPGDVVRGVQKTEHLLLPERPGTTIIPAFSVAYFDPEAKSYAVAKTPPLRIEVAAAAAGAGAGVGANAPGSPAAASAGAAVPAAGVENVVGLDVRPIRAKSALRRELGTTLYRSRAFVGLLVAPPLAFGLTVLIGRVRESLSQDTERTRRRRLRRLARRRLGAAEAHLAAGQTASFFIEIDRVLRELLSGRLGRPVTGLARDELRALLMQAEWGGPLVDQTIAALDECDRARFAPGSVGTEAMNQALERAGDVILQMEKTRMRKGGAA